MEKDRGTPAVFGMKVIASRFIPEGQIWIADADRKRFLGMIENTIGGDLDRDLTPPPLQGRRIELAFGDDREHLVMVSLIGEIAETFSTPAKEFREFIATKEMSLIVEPSKILYQAEGSEEPVRLIVRDHLTKSYVDMRVLEVTADKHHGNDVDFAKVLVLGDAIMEAI